MKISFKKGTRLLAGNLPVVLTADTALDVGEMSYDDVAKHLATSQKAFAENVSQLTHEETVQREGKPVKVTVSYGVGGARIETDIA